MEDAAVEARALEEELIVAFGEQVECAARSAKRLYVGVAPDRMPAVFDWLRERFEGFRLATSTVIDLRDGVGVFHHCVINGQPLVVTLKILAPKPAPTVPSLTSRTPAADWIEREMHDMCGVDFDGHPDLRRLIKAKAFPDTFPMRRDFDPAAFKESIGERPD